MNNQIKKLAYSFYYAFCGIAFCLKNEKNFRIHTILSMYVIIFSAYYDLTKAEFAVLVLIIGLVLSFEMINTAIEQTVNIIAPTQNPIAKIAKDVSAGAVLVFAVISVIIGIMFFADMDVLMVIFKDITSNLPNMAMLIGSIVVSLSFIFKFGNSEK